MSENVGFFGRNKPVSLAIIIACMLFIGIFFLEKSRIIISLIPTFRGEVSLPNNMVITTTKSGYPIIIKKDDPKVGAVRFSGEVRSNFDRVVHNLYSSNSVIIEVGSHFGERTVEFGNRVKRGGKVYAFEANFGIFSNLRKSIILNDLEHTVFLKNVAIYDYKGSIDIRDNLSLRSQEHAKAIRSRLITVDCNTLDSEMAFEEGAVDLLSIDIPELEFQILKGSTNVIDRSPNIVIVISFDNDPPFKNAHEELEKFRTKGFKFYIAENKGSLKLIKIDELLKKKEVILIITKKDLSNLIIE